MTLPLVPPMLATTGQPERDQSAWSWECKWDGWRAMVYLDGGLRVRTRRGREVSAALPELSGLVEALGGRDAILDGELVACPDGVVDFYALAPRMSPTGRSAVSAVAAIPVTFVAFDLLRFDGEDLTKRPLAERKRLLDDLTLTGPSWATNTWHPGDDSVYEACISRGHEGVVAGCWPFPATGN